MQPPVICPFRNTRLRTTFIVFIVSVFYGIGVGRPCLAIGTSYWTQTSEADFKSGTLENVVATNLGDLKLSRAIKTLSEQDPQVSTVYSLAEAPDGSIYAGTGPNGLLLRIKDEKVSTVLTLKDAAAILSIVIDPKGAITLGTGGDAGRVIRIDKPGDEPHKLFEAEGIQYIWGLAQTPDGNLYAATGPHGQLFEIKPDGSKRMLLEIDESNLLSLISDGNDLLYVGTDPHGLVYRVNRVTGKSFVLYNCAESEVSALALDKAGNLYAGTSEAKEEPIVVEPAGASDRGRPEGGGTGIPIPSERPKEPAPPAPPNVNPGQPDPIPKTSGPSQATRAKALRVSHFLAVGSAPRAIPAIPKISFGDADLMNVGRFRGSGVPAASVDAETRGGTPRPRELFSNTSRPRPLLAHTSARIVLAKATDAPGDNPAPGDPGNKKKHPRPEPGKPNPGPNPAPNPNPAPARPDGPPPAPAVHPPVVDTTGGTEPRPEGNAIYKIDPDGFVTEVFRQPVLILSLLENNGTLLVATGGAEGQVYQVRPAAEETVVLAKVDPKQIMCLLPARDGKVYLGTANIGSVAAMSGGYGTKGTYASSVFDAMQISRFGRMHLHGALPARTALTISTRSGNVREADEKTWSKWSDETLATEFVPVTSPSARFLQYRLTFTSTEGRSTAIVRDVSIAYQVPNLPPQIKGIKIANGGALMPAATPNQPLDALKALESKPLPGKRATRITIP